VVGILLRAAAHGDIELETELDALREAGFWISDDLYERALEMDRE
jgi:predicted nucleic acid-binding protein